MAKKKTEKTTTPSMFDYLDGLQEPKKTEPTADHAALLARIEAQDRLLADLQAKGTQNYPMVQTTAPQAPQHQVDPSSIKVSLDGLPDRDTDPDGYWREYTTRTNAALQAQNAATKAQLIAQFEQERNADRLWNGFKEIYPAWGKYTSLVETVSNRVFNDLENKGVDVRRLVQGQPEKFYAEVDSALRQQYGKLVEDTLPDGKGADEDEDEEFLDPMDPALVAGVGGAGSGSAERGAQKVSKGSEPDMLTDLQAIQKRMGIA